MRLLVILSPTDRWGTKTEYTRLRKFLHKDGSTVTMAAHLVYIKTRMLLSIEDEEAKSEMDQLIKSLEERKRNEEYIHVKAMAEKLGVRSEYGRDI